MFRLQHVTVKNTWQIFNLFLTGDQGLSCVYIAILLYLHQQTVQLCNTGLMEIIRSENMEHLLSKLLVCFRIALVSSHGLKAHYIIQDTISGLGAPKTLIPLPMDKQKGGREDDELQKSSPDQAEVVTQMPAWGGAQPESTFWFWFVCVGSVLLLVTPFSPLGVRASFHL